MLSRCVVRKLRADDEARGYGALQCELWMCYGKASSKEHAFWSLQNAVLGYAE